MLVYCPIGPPILLTHHDHRIIGTFSFDTLFITSWRIDQLVHWNRNFGKILWAWHYWLSVALGKCFFYISVSYGLELLQYLPCRIFHKGAVNETTVFHWYTQARSQLPTCFHQLATSSSFRGGMLVNFLACGSKLQADSSATGILMAILSHWLKCSDSQRIKQLLTWTLFTHLPRFIRIIRSNHT